MTTYNTYQEAKIANPECEIFHVNGICFFNYEALASDICNPSDYCMTVEKFLKDNCKFDDGDTYLDWKGRARIVGKVGFSKDACNDIRNIVNADQAFILRTALEEKKPRTKVEYVDVNANDDAFWEVAREFTEDGVEFRSSQDNCKINDNLMLLTSYSNRSLQRRIETPMSEREVFIEGYESLCAEFIQDDTKKADDWAGYVFDKLVN